jgi:hypothetical protein
VAQRFGSALNLNLHFHALVLDGVYASPDPFTRPRFHPAERLSDRDVAEVTALLHRRIAASGAWADDSRRSRHSRPSADAGSVRCARGDGPASAPDGRWAEPRLDVDK